MPQEKINILNSEEFKGKHIRYRAGNTTAHG